MNKLKILIAVVCGVGFLCAVVAVTASNLTSSTPLYTFRMEQASSKMSFLPTERNEIVYTTEPGHTFNSAGHHVYPLEEPTVPVTCPDTCEETCSTCYYTCEGNTCEGTCYSTCPNTCSTCEPTCEQPSCWNTCSSTCSTCKPCSTYRDCP
jgi:hypothetical protein